MSRSLTAEEKNKVKNLQVSNSIYRREIKDVLAEIAIAQSKLDELKAQEPNLLGEKHAAVCNEITQLDSTIKSKFGQIAYKEGRMAAKEQEIADIRTKASREEETVAESYDPNSPEAIEARNIKLAAKEQAKANSKKHRSRSSKDSGPVSEEM